MALPALVDLDYFADYLQVEAADLERGGDSLLDAASALVRNRGTGQRLDLVEGDVATFYGEGSAVILLDELPVHEVTSVTSAPLGYSTPTPTTLTVHADYRVELGRDGRRAMLRRRGGVWLVGEEVVVTYSHGYRLTPDPEAELEVPDLPDDLKLIVCRIAARGIANPLSLVQQSAGRVVQQFGFDASRVATLTEADVADLAPYRPVQ